MQQHPTNPVQQIAKLAHLLSQATRTPSAYFQKDFTEHILALETLAKDAHANTISAPLLNTRFFRTHAATLRSAYELYEEFIETRALLCALEGGDPLDNAQLRRTFEYAQKEAAAANVTRTSRVAFVGSGPFPETALALLRATGCAITCIDHHPEAVVLSQALFDKHHLHTLNSVCSDARTFDYSGFTHILVAVLARPKKEILDRIAKTCDKHACIICRTVEGLKTLIYEPPDDIPLDALSLIDSIRDPTTIIHSLIFKPC